MSDAPKRPDWIENYANTNYSWPADIRAVATYALAVEQQRDDYKAKYEKLREFAKIANDCINKNHSCFPPQAYIEVFDSFDEVDRNYILDADKG